MQNTQPDPGKNDNNPYSIHAAREIVALLRTLGEKNQLIRMLINGGTEAVVTSILEVDVGNNAVIIDCAIGTILNQRIVEADRVSFEATLDKIRILFTATQVTSCRHDDRPALQISIPTSLIRLQRREFYRVSTPVTNPVRCTIPLSESTNEKMITLALLDVSCGGVSIVDEMRILDDSPGKIYRNCMIDLPGSGVVTSSLLVMNSEDQTLLNNRKRRRLGCQFVELSPSTLASIQRYISKLERDLSAKLRGLA
jgi:c-di-GMP-binding flagellar brake protein YcgR